MATTFVVILVFSLAWSLSVIALADAAFGMGE